MNYTTYCNKTKRLLLTEKKKKKNKNKKNNNKKKTKTNKQKQKRKKKINKKKITKIMALNGIISFINMATAQKYAVEIHIILPCHCDFVET